jgi:hypothetical protein
MADRGKFREGLHQSIETCAENPVVGSVGPVQSFPFTLTRNFDLIPDGAGSQCVSTTNDKDSKGIKPRLEAPSIEVQCCVRLLCHGRRGNRERKQKQRCK